MSSVPSARSAHAARASHPSHLAQLARGGDTAIQGRRPRSNTPGTQLKLLVLAVDVDQCAGVDLASGALVRAWYPEPVDLDMRPYDVVIGTIDDSADLLPDPTEPEAVVIAGPPSYVGRITGRQAERYLRPLVHPPGQPLLGSYGPAVAFWERTPDHPSIALVEPEAPAAVVRDQDGWLSCAFRWRGLKLELPLVDRRVANALAGTGQTIATTGKGDRLVVALTPPIDGHCHKVVAALLPRP